MSCCQLPKLLAAVVLGVSATAAGEQGNVTLLVPGILGPLETSRPVTTGPKGADPTWTCMITFLREDGFAFGGTIRPGDVDIRLPGCLAPGEEAVSAPKSADVFVLEFSPAARTDGLAFRALELSQCLVELHQFTGKRINLFAHSAGGLAARAVLQEAIPGVANPGCIDRLITIGTPHLGAALAENFGDWIGTRTTSLKPSAPLIRRLNTRPLPEEVCYASIVVRAMRSGVRHPGKAYDGLLNPRVLEQLPMDFRLGGDEVVHVRTQNLRLAPPADLYERKTDKAIHAVAVRIPRADFSSEESCLKTVHAAALADRSVLRWVTQLLSDNGDFWRDRPSSTRDALMEWQVQYAVFSAIEAHALAESLLPIREVSAVEVLKIQSTNSDEDTRRYQFSGSAIWEDVSRGRSNVSGSLELAFDRFGRAMAPRSQIDKSR